MKLKTLLLAGVAALFTSRSFAQMTATPSVFLASAQYGKSGLGVNFGGGELGGDALAVGAFALVILLGVCFGRCHRKAGQADQSSEGGGDPDRPQVRLPPPRPDRHNFVTGAPRNRREHPVASHR